MPDDLGSFDQVIEQRLQEYKLVRNMPIKARIIKSQGPPDPPMPELGDCEIVTDHINVPLYEINVEGQKLKVCREC